MLQRCSGPERGSMISKGDSAAGDRATEILLRAHKSSGERQTGFKCRHFRFLVFLLRQRSLTSEVRVLLDRVKSEE